MRGLRHHEFWNTHLFHLPIYLYWLYLSLKARSLFFFSAANPSIESGGLIGESKYKILQMIDPRHLPPTMFFSKVHDIDYALKSITDHHIKFPFIVKPDVGQGGWLVELIRSRHEFERFVSKIKMPFIVQEYVDLPVELGVLYYRYPRQTRGTISSLSIKEMLIVTGDGKHNVAQLIKANPRACKHFLRIQQAGQINLQRVPEVGEAVKLSYIANHSYGTTFKNANHLIVPELTAYFDQFCSGIEGFYFGRFDVRCSTIAGFLAGDFKVLELNGVGSEPLHIFDPQENLFNAYRDAFQHWKVIYEIAMQNKGGNQQIMNLREAWQAYQNLLKLQRFHQTKMTIGN